MSVARAVTGPDAWARRKAFGTFTYPRQSEHFEQLMKLPSEDQLAGVKDRDGRARKCVMVAVPALPMSVWPSAAHCGPG